MAAKVKDSAGKSGGFKLAAGARVYSYLRFSRPEQAQGDSIRRQLEGGERWAAARGVKIDESLADHGVSGWSGANVAEGSALGSFIRLVQLGKIKRGSYLLVENLDRLSRQRPERALRQLLELIESGITVVTLSDGKEYGENPDPFALMGSLMIMVRAHEESEIKSMRCGAAWGEKKLNAAKGEIVTAQIPAWCKLEGGKIVADKKKADIVRRIFKLAIDGYGLNAIGTKLTREGVSMGRAGRVSRGWLNRLFRTRTVLGEYQPHKYVKREGLKRGSERVPVGEPIQNYYPAIVDERTYYAARQAMTKRLRSGKLGEKYINLFPPRMLTNNDDGKAFHLRHTMAGKNQGTKYIPYSVLEGMPGAVYTSFPVAIFEKAILLTITDVAAWAMKGDSEAERRHLALAEAEGKLTEVTAKVQRVQDKLLTDNDAAESDAVVDLLVKLQKQKAELTAKLETLREQSSGGVHTEAVTDVISLMKATINGTFTKQQRITLRSAIARIIEHIEARFVRDKWSYICKARIYFRNGSEHELTFVARRVKGGNKHKGKPTQYALDIVTGFDADGNMGVMQIDPPATEGGEATLTAVVHRKDTVPSAPPAARTRRKAARIA